MNRVAGAVVVLLLVTLFAARARWVGGHVKALAPVGGGDPAPGFSLPLLDGETFQLRSGEVTVLDFWATWCEPCRVVMPHMERLHRRYKDRGVRFVAVNIEGNEMLSAISSLVRSLQLTMPIGLDDGSVSALYKVSSLPTLAVIGRDGTIARVLVGVHGEDELARIIDKQLAAQ